MKNRDEKTKKKKERNTKKKEYKTLKPRWKTRNKDIRKFWKENMENKTIPWKISLQISKIYP